MFINVLDAGNQKKHPYKVLRELLFRPYWFPIVNAKWELKDLGIHVHFFDSIKDGLWDCDILIISSRTAEAIVRKERFGLRSLDDFCVYIRTKFNGKLFWFDSRDSAGNCHFNVLPHVDKYLKRSVYRDKSTYLKSLSRGREYSDYYTKKFNLPPEADGNDYRSDEKIETLDQLDKMQVAWGCGAEFHWPLINNLSMPRYMYSAVLSQAIQTVPPVPEWVSVNSVRDIDICALFNSDRYHVKSVGYQRKLGLEAAEQLQNCVKVCDRVPRKEFYNTLMRSKVCVSVFGWGEVCYREYEATYCGSAILMADMSNIDTYPDFYVANKYYIPFKWDFSDFAEKAMDLIANTEQREHMVRESQNFLLSQWNEQGRQAFAKRFMDILES